MKVYYACLNTASSFLKSLSLLIILLLLFTFNTSVQPAHATGVYDLPQLVAGNSTWVVDSADAISLANEGKLNSASKELASKTGQELRFVAIRRLNYGETIDSFATELFKSWFPTPEEQSNQTLVVLDTLSNNSAIRRGQAAKEFVTEDIANSIIEESIGLRLREGNKYNQALLDVSDRLAVVLSGETDPGSVAVAETIETEGTFTKAEDTDAGSATVWVIALLLAATVIPMVTYFWYVGFPGN